MPNLVKQIPEEMKKQGISEETLKNFDIPKTSSSEDVIMLINQMDKLLTEKQRISIMQEQGCCTTGKPAAAHRDFGRKHASKTLAEKIELLSVPGELNSGHNPPCRLNDDGTLSVFWGESGTGEVNCPCGILKKLPESYDVPLTFCGCCGGHARKNLQRSLGVRLQLIKIVSSSSNSGGAKRCEFLYKLKTSKC